MSRVYFTPCFDTAERCVVIGLGAISLPGERHKLTCGGLDRPSQAKESQPKMPLSRISATPASTISGINSTAACTEW